MNLTAPRSIFAVALAVGLGSCGGSRPAEPPAPARTGGGGGDGSRPADGPQPYGDVITEEAVTEPGTVAVHEVGDDLFFEIRAGEVGNEMLLIQRAMESTPQEAGAFFGGGPRPIVQWEREGGHLVLREKEYDLIANEGDPIWRQVSGIREGPVVQRFDIEAFGPDSSAVIDVSDLGSRTSASPSPTLSSASSTGSTLIEFEARR